MAARNYILATAGHVDHGKSALVKALTGHDPDRLPEEKARGITIDLGFAHLRLPASTSELNIGIVDVPGHEDFVKNMVAGIGAIDAALLVVAADDGWMPQSEEHLQILEYAGIRNAVVALTKCDRIARSARAEAIGAVRARLAGTALAEAPIVPTSVMTAEGIDELRLRLAECLARSGGPRDVGKPRLWVDRAFSLRGVGTIVTGSLRGGALETGQGVVIGGRGTLARIRTLHQHNAVQPAALPGTRTALNLMGVSTGTDAGAVVTRGDLITLPDLAPAHDTCDVVLMRSHRTAHVGSADRSLVHGAIVRLHVGTAAVTCRVVLADRPSLAPGETCIAQLRLDLALPLADGERVILRDSGGRMTLAGGLVLETRSSRKRFRAAAQQAFLAAQATAPDDCGSWIDARLRRDEFVSIRDLQSSWRFGHAGVAEAVDRLVRAGTAARGEGWVGVKERWAAVKQNAEQRIAAHEHEHPTQNGLPLAQLRLAVGARLPTDVFQSLVAELTAGAFEIVGAAIRHREYRPSLPSSLQAAAAEVAAALRRARLNPPARKDVARTVVAAEALEFLIKTGRVVALGPELALAASVYHAATRAVCEQLEASGRATVSELKQALGVSRRVMVPLLERMDRDGLTLREGEYRVLRKMPETARKA